MSERLTQYAGALTNKGMAPDQAAKVARGLLSRTVDSQAQLRAMMDYYLLISIVLVVVLLVIALFPKLNRTKIDLKSNQPSPAVY
ncbi:hypothetical protein [Pedobacter sp. NJ-S-72]